MSPRTDLCDSCQHFRDGLHYNARQEEEAKDLLKRFKEHLSKAKLERNCYNKNTKLAEEQRKLVDQNYSKGKTKYCSIDATAHYSYDPMFTLSGYVAACPFKKLYCSICDLDMIVK